MPGLALRDITNASQGTSPDVKRPRRSSQQQGYQPGRTVLCLHPTDGWIEGTVQSLLTDGGASVHTPGGSPHDYPTDQLHYHPKGRGGRSTSEDGSEVGPVEATPSLVDNLLHMSDLHEATIVHTLRSRFSTDLCYTYMGDMVVAVNPFKNTHERIEQYLTRMEGLTPHSWQVAHATYASLLSTGRDQSILISGESGAGKTESTKHVIRYLGELSKMGGGGCGGSTTAGSINARLNEANPLLEAFGNAKTLRNNNSSRFGKFIRVRFDGSGNLTGADVTNYLLEQSRVVAQNPGERGYHIFYHWLAGCTDSERELYHLGTPDQFRCLIQGGCTSVPDMDDAECFRDVLRAMDVIGITPVERESVFRLLSSILHLQNVLLIPIDDDSTKIRTDDGSIQSLRWAAELLKLDPTTLESTLTTRTTTVRGEAITKPLNAPKAVAIRDCISKSIYDAVFNWLVRRVNESLAFQGGSSESAPAGAFIGILDIFGFERFDVNSFEQLCINYTNESLQNHYNWHVFAQEIEEYKREGVDVATVKYTDNQPCLNLIAARHTGILSLLEEECNFPRATDATFAEKLYAQHSGCTFFAKPRMARPCFTVRHYAGEVEYTVTDFLEKNKTTHRDTLPTLLSHSTCPFVALLLATLGTTASTGSGTPRTRSTTLGTQFRQQLQDLNVVIRGTQPHWIRCIKPNVDQIPGVFDGRYVMEQLNSSGVRQTLEMIRVGYPYRILHRDFWGRFRAVAPQEEGTDDNMMMVDNPPLIDRCRALVDRFLSKGTTAVCDCQVGLTRVFLRQGAHDHLVALRREQEDFFIRRVQQYARRVMSTWALRSTLRQRVYVTRIQRAFRARRAHRREVATCTLQHWWRRQLFIRSYKTSRVEVVQCEESDRHILLEHWRYVDAFFSRIRDQIRTCLAEECQGRDDIFKAAETTALTLMGKMESDRRDVEKSVQLVQVIANNTRQQLRWKERYDVEKAEWEAERAQLRAELAVCAAERDEAIRISTARAEKIVHLEADAKVAADRLAEAESTLAAAHRENAQQLHQLQHGRAAGGLLEPPPDRHERITELTKALVESEREKMTLRRQAGNRPSVPGPPFCSRSSVEIARVPQPDLMQPGPAGIVKPTVVLSEDARRQSVMSVDWSTPCGMETDEENDDDDDEATTCSLMTPTIAHPPDPELSSEEDDDEDVDLDGLELDEDDNDEIEGGGTSSSSEDEDDDDGEVAWLPEGGDEVTLDTESRRKITADLKREGLWTSSVCPATINKNRG